MIALFGTFALLLFAPLILMNLVERAAEWRARRDSRLPR